MVFITSSKRAQLIVVIITGASSGIGEATAKELASKGAKLVLAARREERIKTLQHAIQFNGGVCIHYR
ncbi:SDR family NAD(P)-dependent oxidoreductase [Paenibacillus sp. HJL G12]|uniref:SDR family NAD(P)-dependent oxidoreductase n=1 Tax=Paenibacillus dendrobii TaxID=2691084 RepID=A0A7X3IEQ0_9BACL|nr:SDR family NAD(P)-dependent oxidoreductase [Paenibacillus dendrobii]MWV42549.1 SDR family NAD(P)-dependent oxidoreductase [Paenibacillus dendrobii]